VPSDRILNLPKSFGISCSFRACVLAAGLFAVVNACWLYYCHGFHWPIFVVWLLGLAFCGMILAFDPGARLLIPRISDLLTALALMVVAVPLYVWSVYYIPFRMNSDEIVLIDAEHEWLRSGVIDLFGLSDYFGFMYSPFLIQGWCAQWLGGINLYHVRLLHAICGVIIVGFSFIFFRMVGLRWLMALSASVFMAANHSLVAISRIASRTNGGLLLEMLALYFLFAGVKNKSQLSTYIGGVLTGLCFYVYYSARVTLPVWVIFLLVLFVAGGRSLSRAELVRFGLVFAFGLALSVMPAAVAHIRAGSLGVNCLEYQKQQCLLYPEGRNLCARWMGADTIQEGVVKNIVSGLTVFNNNVQDQAYIYNNPDHGFVDPLSGILLWLGFFRVLIRFRAETAAIFMLSGFLFLWLFYSFLIAEAPNYTRLLVILPFAGYFVANGIELVSVFLSRQLARRRASVIRTINSRVFLSANLSIVVWNLAIFYDYANWGLVHGDDLGGTVRYIEARSNQPNHLFIVASNHEFPYFGWDAPGAAKDRVKPFIMAQQDNKAWAPEDLTAMKLVPPFTIFMDGDLWRLKQERLTAMYPHLVVHKIFDDRALVAVEDAEETVDSARIHLAYRRFDDYPERCRDKLWLGHQDEVISLCLDVLKAPEAKVNGSLFRSEILLLLGSAYLNEDKFKQAESAFLEALHIREKVIGRKVIDTATVTDALGELYKSQGKWSEAESSFRDSVAIREAFQKDDGCVWVYGLAHSYSLLAKTLVAQERIEEAEMTFRKAASLCHVDGGESDEKADILEEVASCHKALLNLSKKISSLEAAIARTKSPDALANLYARLGFEYMKEGDCARARATYSLAIKAKLAQGMPKRNEALAQIYAQRGFVNSKLKNYSEAEQDYDLAIKLSSTKFARQKHYERDRRYAHDQKISSK
jgi:tetratricopeptide (TPR) repeat protein